MTVSNFYAAILGDKDAIEGGSGKVVASGPNDHIFIYYTDHGGPGVLGESSISCCHSRDGPFWSFYLFLYACKQNYRVFKAGLDSDTL